MKSSTRWTSPQRARRTSNSRGATAERVAVDYKAAYQACFDAGIAHFVEKLLSGEPFETGPEDNLQTLKLVEDAYALASQRGSLST